MTRVSKTLIACSALCSVLALGCEKKTDAELQSTEQAATAAPIAAQPVAPMEAPAVAPVEGIPAAAPTDPSSATAQPQAAVEPQAMPEAKKPAKR